MNAHAHPRPNYGAIFISLFVLTVLEILTTRLPILKIVMIGMLVSLAIVKAALVAMFYMHLRFEKKLLALVALAPLIFSIIFAQGIGYDLRQVSRHSDKNAAAAKP